MKKEEFYIRGTDIGITWMMINGTFKTMTSWITDEIFNSWRARGVRYKR